MKIVCHAGPWSDDYFRFVSAKVYPDADCVILSGHRKVDESGLWSNYYKIIKEKETKDIEITPADMEIIARCRLMRAINRESALLHVHSMREAVAKTLDDQRPSLVITETIDSFLMDLLDQECVKRNIPCVGLVTVFVNGCFRVSVRGEYVKSRNTSAEEVQETLNELERSDYLPKFVDSDNFTKKTLIRWFRNLIKIPYFFSKRYISGDRYNYHYWQSYIVSFQWASLIPVIDPGDENWKTRLQHANGNVIYVPLQMFPEATIDYWCSSIDIIDYEKKLVEFISGHPEFTFLIKEHPNVTGYRSRNFYRQLKNNSNVVFCPTNIPSNALKEIYEAVLIWTGSVGFETAIRGKPVLCMSTPYYFNEKADYLLISMDTKSIDIINYIKDFDGEKSEDYKFMLTKHLLDGCLPGRVRFDGSWDLNNQEHIEEATQLASSLKMFIESYVMK